MATHTFADVKADPGLQVVSIEIHAFGEVTAKEWGRASVEGWHWQRILAIAETAPGRLVAHPGQGFSWVPAAVIDGEAIVLAPPEHLRDLIAADPS